MKKILFALLLVIAAFVSCTRDPALIAPLDHLSSPVVLDLDAVPYDSLSRYNFFSGNMADLDPVQGVLPFEVITPLFSDYAKKKRFVWMPAGVNASYVNDASSLLFQDGAVLIKNFYYDHVLPDDGRRIIETRLLIRRNDSWVFANYVWNEAQTEAVLDMNGSFTAVQWLGDLGEVNNVNYRIPAQAECLTCHKDNNVPVPIGTKPQNLNSTFAYPDGDMNQLARWHAVGYLAAPPPGSIATTVRWDDATQDLTERVRAYLEMNCAHCHSDVGHCDYRPMRFAWSQTTDPANLGICVPPDEPLLPQHSHIISAGNTERSVLFYRISATDETVRMPLLGRTVVHTEAVQLFEDWINSLSPPCP